MDFETLSFEEAFALLEETVETLEQGNLNLEETLELFDRGMQLASRCNALLDSAELRIQQLMPSADGFRLTPVILGE